MSDVLNSFEGYYGLKYRRPQRAVCDQWLAKIPERNHGILFAEVVRIHPGTYKSLPDVAIFEQAMAAFRERVAEINREEANRLTHEGLRLLEEDAMPKDEIARILHGLPEELGWLSGVVGIDRPRSSKSKLQNSA